MNRLFTRVLPLVFIFLAFAREATAQIYADVTVTGAVSGTFTINLEYQKAPVAVANFIGLANGSKGWLDQNTGSIRYEPFYNGLTFHRVIAGFMSQTGSPNGLGNDGPGYTFQNEIAPSLTFATPYTVGMANSGGSFTNGSQWFVTTTGSNSFLNGNYTLFGTVISGTDVCYAINHVATSGSTGQPPDQPITPVIISSIKISGSSYAAFNLNPNPLPKVLNAEPVMKVSGTTDSLGYDHRSYSYYYLFDSPDLATWAQSDSGNYYAEVPPAGDKDVTPYATGSKHFFRMARVDYSLCYNHFIPASLAGTVLHFDSPLNGSLVVDADQTKTWVSDAYYPYTLSSYNYAAAVVPYGNWGTLTFQLTSGDQYVIDRLEYTSATGGTFVGRTNIGGLSNVSGTFTSTPLP